MFSRLACLSLFSFMVSSRTVCAQGTATDELTIYIVPHSHADLSWPHTPEVSTNLNVQAISESIHILVDLPNFKFSEEDAFVLREFLRRNPERLEEVRGLLQQNTLPSRILASMKRRNSRENGGAWARDRRA